MKKKLILILLGCSTFLAKAQVETPKPPKPDSPLIALVNNTGASILDFNSIDWSDYPNTSEFDFTRMTPLAKLQSGISLSWNSPEDIPVSIIDIDGETVTLEGTTKPVSVKDQKIILGRSTYNVKRMEIKEDYQLIHNGKVIASYSNTYFSYFDGNTLVFEVFDKQQIFEGGLGLGQHFVGISYNVEDDLQQNTINLILSPNPASNQVEIQANFDLWTDGYTVISISNQLATFNRVVYSANLLHDTYSIAVPIKEFPAGNYIVSVLFQGQLFSSNLIIQ
ncbi:hypothetical protein [Fluviicola sp.]|uniref:hypothetical protein n=1 Tax=Fluviicola sp. TaxID=1917219 RepID=UPI0026026312|nr:hypothetical protein [Fluviicola sp.]